MYGKRLEDMPAFPIQTELERVTVGTAVWLE